MSTIALLCLLSFSAVAATFIAQPSSAQPSFQGKTIRIVVAAPTGNNTDILGRQFAPFIAKSIPGNPAVIVENRPGAGGTIGANYVYNVAKPDGETIGFLFNLVTPGLIGAEGVRYDPSRFRWLGAISQTQVLLARKDLELTRPLDLLKPAKPLVLASSSGTSTGSAVDIGNRLFLDMIGAKYKFVTGYTGQAEAILALARGEANLTNAGHTLYLSRRETLRKEGIMDAIVQRGEAVPDGSFRRNQQLGDLPTTIEAIQEKNPAALQSVDFLTYRSIIGAFALNFPIVLPPQTDRSVVETLRHAFSTALNDPEARKAVFGMLKADYEFVDGAASERIIEKIRDDYRSDQRVSERLKQLISGK